jgi:hypothetical protein
MILADTVEPIMIVRDGNPMAGGIMTEIVQLIFEESDYFIEPMVLPWQRMKIEFQQRNDWIVHGFYESFGAETPHEMSELPIIPFNHSAVTLKNSGLTINNYSDLDGRVLILVENFQYPGLDEHIASVTHDESGGNIGVIRAFTPAGSLKMLRHGRGEVVIDWQARLLYNLQVAGLEYENLDFHDATDIVPTKNLHLVFSPNQTDEFKSFVNKRIKALTESGQLFEIVQKYYTPAQAPGF